MCFLRSCIILFILTGANISVTEIDIESIKCLIGDKKEEEMEEKKGEEEVEMLVKQGEEDVDLDLIDNLQCTTCL